MKKTNSHLVFLSAYRDWVRINKAKIGKNILLLVMSAVSAKVLLLIPHFMYSLSGEGIRLLHGASNDIHCFGPLIMLLLTAGTFLLLRRQMGKLADSLSEPSVQSGPEAAFYAASDAKIVADACARGVPRLIGAVFLMIGCLLMMIRLQWKIGIVVTLLSILSLCIGHAFSAAEDQFRAAQTRSQKNLLDFTKECYDGRQVLIMSRAEAQINKKIESYSGAVEEASRRVHVCAAFRLIAANAASSVTLVLIFLLAKDFEPDPVLCFQMIISFLLYSFLLRSAGMQLISFHGMYRQAQQKIQLFCIEKNRKSRSARSCSQKAIHSV